MDIAFDGVNTTNSRALESSTPAPSQITVLRIEGTQLSFTLNMNGIDQLAIIDSSFTKGEATAALNGTYGLYCQNCSKVAMLGSYSFVNPSQNSHNIRLQGVNYFVISNNTLAGNQYSEPITTRGNSQYGVESDNKFSDNRVTISPQNSTAFENQQDILVERNWFVGGPHTWGVLHIEGHAITARNNIFDLSNASGKRAITIAHTSTVGSPMPDLINIYNNTFFNSAANNGNLGATWPFYFYATLDATCHSIIKNNLAYSPNTYNLTPALIHVDTGGLCNITGANGTHGNSSDAQIKTGPNPFVSATPSTPSDFRLTSGSYGLDAGAVVKVFSDFFRNLRPQAGSYDMGAVDGL